jgi:Trk-type K+ transport system membrane component
MWIIDGLFQVTATRTAGFSILSFLTLHPAMQISSMVMMYISVFPTAISMRRTNVYEEKSLGIYLTDSSLDGNDEEFRGSGSSLITTHVRQQLGFDVWYIFLGLFLLALTEGTRLQDREDPFFNIFAVMFETVSAYCTVGLSFGYPGTHTSFSAQFNPLSKLIVVAIQIRGRHRGLPYRIDRAVLLPSDSLNREDLAQESRATLRRHRDSTLSQMSLESRRRLSSHFLRSDSSFSRTVTQDRFLS